MGNELGCCHAEYGGTEEWEPAAPAVVVVGRELEVGRERPLAAEGVEEMDLEGPDLEYSLVSLTSVSSGAWPPQASGASACARAPRHLPPGMSRNRMAGTKTAAVDSTTTATVPPPPPLESKSGTSLYRPALFGAARPAATELGMSRLPANRMAKGGLRNALVDAIAGGSMQKSTDVGAAHGAAGDSARAHRESFATSMLGLNLGSRIWDELPGKLLSFTGKYWCMGIQ